MKKDLVLVHSKDISVRMLVDDRVPPGMAYLVDANTILETDPKTGELKHPFAAAKLTGLEG